MKLTNVVFLRLWGLKGTLWNPWGLECSLLQKFRSTNNRKKVETDTACYLSLEPLSICLSLYKQRETLVFIVLESWRKFSSSSMEKEDDNNKTKDVRMVEVEPLNGFSPVSSTRIFWKSRKRSGSTYQAVFFFLAFFYSFCLLSKKIRERKWRKVLESSPVCYVCMVYKYIYQTHVMKFDISKES